MNKNHRPLSLYILFTLVIFSILSVPFAGFDMVFAQQEVIDTIAVGDRPVGVAYNVNNNHMYVTNLNSDTVSVIDENNDVVETVAVGDGPEAVAYNANNNHMYVTNFISDTVSVIGTILPIADAGSDQTVDSGDTVQLDGTGSSANGGSPIASYQWTQTSGPAVNLDDPTSETPSFTAPLTGMQQNIIFELVVTNEQGVASEPDSVTITVNPVAAPIADAGADQTVDSGNTVQLDGSGSSTNPPGGTLTYQWTQTQGPVVTLDDPTAVNPTFTAPDVLLQRDLVFELVVTNEQGLVSELDSVTITVVSNLDGIVGSGNNINVQIQENTGNNVGGGQSGFGEGTYSDSPIFQGQSTEQDSKVVS